MGQQKNASRAMQENHDLEEKIFEEKKKETT